MARKTYIGVDGYARRVIKGYIGVDETYGYTLPSGYTRLLSVKTDGGNYIDIDVKPSYNTRVVLDVLIDDVTGATRSLFGARDTASNTAANQYVVWLTDNGESIRSDYFGTYQSISKNILGKRVTIDKNANALSVDGRIITNTSVSSGSCSYNMFLGSVNSVGDDAYGAAMEIFRCWVYNDGSLVRVLWPCKNSSGVVGMYDSVNDVFYEPSGLGSLTAGTTDLRVAHKIKKAYIGVGGIARPFWFNGELAYHGTAPSMSTGRYHVSSASIGDYALFAGGYTGSFFNTVDTYNKQLTKSTATTLSAARYGMGATEIGNYALFAGGIGNSSTYQTVVDAYNKSLTRSKPTALSVARSFMGATTVGNYAVFGGGNDYTSARSAVVDAYNSSLTRSTPTVLSKSRYQLAAATIGNYALFAGGDTNANGYTEYYTTVDAYNASLTRSTPTALSVKRTLLAATTVGNYALFGGGSNASRSDAVDAYNSSLTRSTPTVLSVARNELAATTVGNYALFGGGHSTNRLATVDAYDEDLTRTIQNDLIVPRYRLTATTIGDYALFSGGDNNSDRISVDAFVVT